LDFNISEKTSGSGRKNTDTTGEVFFIGRDSGRYHAGASLVMKKILFHDPADRFLLQDIFQDSALNSGTIRIVS
jgi:hypothetical protein